MKLQSILTLMLMNLSIGDRHQRSTVLTDESKRILEQFDFSNFDKQEALNYIDRQRYDNQIRGKRSKPKPRSKATMRPISFRFNGDSEETLPTVDPFSSPYENLTIRDSLESDFGRREKYRISSVPRKRRGHRRTNKDRMIMSDVEEPSESEDYDEDEADFERYRKRRRKKKKRKRRYWSSWSQWSPCSVTCGRGRKIRWRKCIVKNCTTGELEMGEKTCQLPACSLLTKLLAVIKNIKLGSNLFKPAT